MLSFELCGFFYFPLTFPCPADHVPDWQPRILQHAQPSKVVPETTMECVPRAIWGMLYADDACIVSRSPRELERMMAVFVEVFGTFGLTISESKTETMCMSISCAPATQIVFNATGQQYRQTTSFTYLGGTVTETPNLSDEIDRRFRAGWMSFKRYTRELLYSTAQRQVKSAASS